MKRASFEEEIFIVISIIAIKNQLNFNLIY